MKLSNSKYIFLGKIGNSINSLHLTQLDLIKQKKEYLRALKKFSNYQDQLEGLNAFIENNFDSNKRIQKRIVELYIELIIDSKSYGSIVDAIDQKISELQDAIEKYVFDNKGIGAKIRYYTTEINKIIAQIQQLCDKAGIEFDWAPISHTSNRVHTLYSVLSGAVANALSKLTEDQLKTIKDVEPDNDITNDIRAYLTANNLLSKGVYSDALYDLGNGATIDYAINGKPLDLTGDNYINKHDEKEFDALKAEYDALMKKSDKTEADNKRIAEIKGIIDFNVDDNIDENDSAYISLFDRFSYLMKTDNEFSTAYTTVNGQGGTDQERPARETYA